MPTTVTPVDAWTTPIQVPNDGTEIANQASLLLFVQALADQATYMRKGIPGLAASIQVEVPLFDGYNINTRFSRLSSGGVIQSNITDAGEVVYHLPVPPYGKIDQLHLLCDGRDGTFGSAHGGLPATMPQLALKRVTATAGNTDVTTAAVGSTATDSSASAAAYDKVHLISKTGMAHTILADSSYWVSIKGEAGANSIANNFAFYRCYAVLIP